jgi:hypothetical protein
MDAAAVVQEESEEKRRMGGLHDNHVNEPAEAAFGSSPGAFAANESLYALELLRMSSARVSPSKL